MNYKVIGKSYKDIAYENEQQFNAETESFYETQLDTFYKLFPNDAKVIFHYFNSAFRNESFVIGYTSEIDDYIDGLAIKDGIDIVQYENGNYGFMANYSGRGNGFEIMPLSMPIKH